jgi:type I restriction enzyme S subunit
MSKWPKVRLGDVLQLDLHKEPVDISKAYEMVGVLSFGRGLFKREIIENGNTSYKYFLRLSAEHVVMSQLFGWEGALALSSEDFEGSFVSPQFPTFLCDQSRLNREFLGWVMRQPCFWDDLGSRAKGMGDRRRTLNPESLFASNTPLPPIIEQKAIIARLNQLSDKIRQVNEHLNAIEANAEALIRSYIFSPNKMGGHKLKMSEIVTLRQPDVVVDQLENYQFAGVYSFGRGVFASVNKAGSEFAYPRLSTIKKGDFIFPKLMAWEGPPMSE